MPNKKNVLVIGGAGFIGSHLCERLLADANVICVDNFCSSGENNINHLLRSPSFKFINADITEKIEFESIKDLDLFQIKVFGVKEIYNLACPTSVNNFQKLRKQTVLANTFGLVRALELAVKYKSKFLQASSSVVYGKTERDQYIAEDYRGVYDMLDPRACYDEGKRYAESVVETYRQVHNLDTKIVRIFRTYGARMLINDGQMLPDFILNALEDKDLIINGNEDFRTSLCYVSDIVEGCIKIMESAISEPINIGSTEVYKLVDVAEKIIEMIGSKSKVKFEESKLFMRELALPDITKAREKLGWIPIVTLEDGLQKTIDFTKAHKNLLTFSTEI
ncbi:GDP-mannose 4,6-dehydratase [Candidatus Falkowbacteria bacterium]|nr:GDP-mannose 4,6-dehydratase [Candidatus Falkowbacteria bacterium]